MSQIIKISQKTPITAENLLSCLKLDGKKMFFVTDAKIWQNCAQFFAPDFLENNQNLILKNPEADEKNLKKITALAKKNNFILCLGSGTINDLCKLSAANLKIPYAVFASAASMNGYLSKNASITIKGHKKTLAAATPLAVFYDPKILKLAPAALTKAGIGDSMCFYSCWFDWYLSHLILKTKFDPEPFNLLTKKMAFLLKNYQKFSLKDEKFLEILIEILLLSGQGMTAAGGSYPASQSEHLIAHTLSMKYPQKLKNILHGNQIAITVLTSAALQKDLLKRDSLLVKKTIFPIKELTKFFGKKIAEECQKEFVKKILSDAEINKINMRLQKEWKNYRAELNKIHLDISKLKEIFSHFKIQTSLAAKTISKQEYKTCVAYAKFIRNRFTCLDL